MSRVLRLYPRAWRERYRDEVEALLAERPATLWDSLDLGLGALDAWLHPQVVGAAVERAARSQRSLAIASGSIVGGGLWIASGLLMNTTRIDASLGYKNVDFPILLLVLGAIATAVGAIHVAWSATLARGMRTAAGLMLPLAILIATPWPFMLIGFFGYAIAVIAFGLRLAFGGQPWVGLPLAVSGFLMTSLNTEDEQALLTVPLGLAWIALGSLAVRRGVSVRPIAASAGT